jgi:hypothetical protein
MADINDLFFFGDDFDAIFDILEDEEELEEQFTEAASVVSIRIFHNNFNRAKKCLCIFM